jgi:hypothetical protein
MYRIQPQYGGARRASWRGLLAALVAGLLLASSTARAEELQQSLPSGDCDVSSEFHGEGVLDFTDGEDWVEFSIELTGKGDVLVNGLAVGAYIPLTGARVVVHLVDGNAYIEVFDACTGALCCSTSLSVDPVGLAVAAGGAVSLDAE